MLEEKKETVPPLLLLENLHVAIHKGKKSFPLIKDVSFSLYPQETLALVGESGSGKSITAQAIIQLFYTEAIRATQGKIIFAEKNLLHFSLEQMRNIRGKEISFIPQNPLSALNPTSTIGFQLMEAIKTCAFYSKKEKQSLAADMLALVGFADPIRTMNTYPHELSGGMRQRVLIAMALINKPKLVIADEPTTALDMTIQAQILDLLKSLQKQFRTSLLFITHDFGVVAQIADRVAVMYAGQVVECADVNNIFYSPQHSYTQSLIHSLPNPQESYAHD